MSFARNLQVCEKLFDSVAKTGLDAAKPAFKKVVHKTAEAKGEWIGKKLLNKCETKTHT